MNTIDNLFHRAALLLIGALVLTGFAACGEKSSSDDVGPAPVDVVEHPVAVVQYEGSKQAKNDVQTLAEIATKLTAMRWVRYLNYTDNFNAETNFKGDIHKADWDSYFQLISDIANNADDYVEAMQRLTDNGIWDAQKVAVTRGDISPPLKDVFMCLYNADKALDSGHGKIFDVINSNKAELNTPEMWKKLYDWMPDDYRFGETDYRQWRNRVYNHDYGNVLTRSFISSKLFMHMCEVPEFDDAARDLCGNKDPRGCHINQVGTELTKQGMNLEVAFYKTFNPTLGHLTSGIDLGMASVSLANAVDKGDPNAARDAMLTISNVISTEVGGFDNNASWWQGETVNISYELMNQTVISDLNQAVADENALNSSVGLLNIKDIDNTGAQVFIIDNGNGQTKIAVATNGEAKVPFTKNGTYTITGVDSNGNTSTTTVGAKTGETTTAEVDTKKKDDEDIPSNPRLTVTPDGLSFDGDEDEMTVTVNTNYRYYGVKADQEWITATPLSGSNKVRISVPMNPTGKERKGHVYVMATDKAGNILKTVAVSVYQERNDAGGVVPETDVLRFSSNAYSKSIGVELIDYEYLGAFLQDDKDKGWLSVSAGATDRYVTVYVEENKTGKERTGTILVMGSNTLDPESNGGYMTVPVTVIQEPEGKLSLSPSSLSFEVNGGSATLSATMEGYAKLGSFIDTDGQGWLEVVPDGASKTVSVTCKKNETGKERTGHFYVFATNFDDPIVGDIKQVKVEVKQLADNTKPYVSPSTLSYPAEGGTQNVQVNEGDYTRGGYSISNEGKGWVSVSFTSFSKGLDITVQPNTTGQKRTCTVNCHLAMKDNPSADEIVTLPIAITQEANELQPGDIMMNEVQSCELTAVAMMKDRSKGTISSTEYKQNFTSATFTQDGTTVHVQSTNNYNDGEYDVYQNLISFDIVNFGGNFSTCKIENLTFRHVYSNNYVDWTQPGLYGKGDDVEMELTNLPWQGVVSTYKNGGNSSFTYSGPVTSGVAFLKLTEKKVGYSEEHPTQYFDYVENNNNRAMLIVKFKASGTSMSRLELSLPLTNDPTPNGIIWNI